MPAVSIKNLCKSYGDVQAVDDLSLDVERGEILGLLGPNGAGKTTTIQCLCGLSTITSGTITVLGVDVTVDPVTTKSRIGLSEQEPKGDLYFPVERILRYQAGYHGIRNADALIERHLRDFGLTSKRSATFRQLSGGMKRKVSIVKALIHDPDVIILDEPTAGLDIESRYELWWFVRELKSRGKTIILTTHYIEEAEQLADRIAIIDEGRLRTVQRTSRMLEEFGSSRIILFFESPPRIMDLDGLDVDVDGSKLTITCPRKDQNRVLRHALQVYPDAVNVQVDQDKLESIFRRLLDRTV
ncbi:MAG: ABC transporter ATP-binding protein [Candidatus Woesearchaeota archaeon]